MEYRFSSSQFESICVLRSELDFLVDSVYMGLVFVFNQSLCILVGAFNPFTFKVIIDIYVPIAIFLEKAMENWAQLSDFTFTFHFHALEEMTTHSSILARRIPGMEEPGGLPSMGSHRDRHD